MAENIITPENIDSTPSQIVEGNLNEDIDKLQRAFLSVESAFRYRLLYLRMAMWTFLSISGLLILCVWAYYYQIFVGGWKPNFKVGTIEIWYDVGIRLIMMSLVISVIVFCIKMTSKYLLLCGEIRHKISIINSMPSLLHSSGDKKLFNTLYVRITEMLVNITDNKLEPIEIPKLDGLIESIKKLTDKK
ncbi:MAG: hypothetical protein V4649_07095 [Bacteroidota bacterium]